MNDTKIFISDKYNLYHLAIKNALKQSKIKIVGECFNSRDTAKGIKSCKPNILISDYQFNEELPVNFFADLRKQFPKLKIVILTMNCSREILLRYINYLDGFLSKGTSTEHLVAAIEEVANGGFYYFIPHTASKKVRSRTIWG